MALTNNDAYEVFLRINEEKVLRVKVAYNEDTEMFPYYIAFIDGENVYYAEDGLTTE